jgi:hypothetical protein
METLAKAWWNWRLQQAANVDPMNPPIGAGAIGGIVRNAAPAEAGIIETALRSMARIPVSPKALEVAQSAAETPGQASLASILGGPDALAAHQAAAEFPLAGRRADVLQNAADIRRQFKAPSKMKPDYSRGEYQGTWYTGAYPQLEQDLETLRWSLPSADRRLVDLSKDPLLLAKQIAATSPQQQPLDNVRLALKAYTEFLKSGRDPNYIYRGGAVKEGGGGWGPGHSGNLQAALRGDPLSGLKVSNYLLDILGSEQAPPVDRWMVNILLGKPTAKAGVSDTEYQVAADRIKELAAAFGTTPVRAQAAMWTGAKLLRDERITSLLDKNLTREQAVPALREVIHAKMQELAQKVSFDPKIITPSVALGAIMLDLAKEEQKATPGGS